MEDPESDDDVAESGATPTPPCSHTTEGVASPNGMDELEVAEYPKQALNHFLGAGGFPLQTTRVQSPLFLPPSEAVPAAAPLPPLPFRAESPLDLDGDVVALRFPLVDIPVASECEGDALPDTVIAKHASNDPEASPPRT